EGASANQGASTGAKIFGGKVTDHNFFDVVVDVTSLHVHEFAFTVLILEDFTRRMPQQLSDDTCYRAIAKFAVLLNAGFSGKVENDEVASSAHMLRPKRCDSVAAVFVSVDLTA